MFVVSAIVVSRGRSSIVNGGGRGAEPAAPRVHLYESGLHYSIVVPRL